MCERLVATGLEVRIGARQVLVNGAIALQPGEVVALVGSSGSGKTLLARSLLGLVDLHPGIVAGEVTLHSAHHPPTTWRAPTTRAAREAAFQPIRRDAVGWLPQDAQQALDPFSTVERQVGRAARGDVDVDALLVRAGFSTPGAVRHRYPHQLSGGMAQRVGIAVALARKTCFFIADEPTTGLDPVVAGQVHEALRALAEAGVGVLWITHDLRAVRGIAHRVIVLDAGHIVERCSPDDLVHERLASDAGRSLLDATRRIAGGVLG